MTPTPNQNAAIESKHNAILCLAGPGSGKTQTTVERIKRTIAAGTPPGKIVALTFTNAAARELQERLREEDEPIYHVKGVDGPIHLGYCGTLHGFAFRMLRLNMSPLAVISPESAQDLLELKARALGCRDPLKKLLEIKAAGIDPTKRMTIAETTVASFLQDLRNAGIVDFDILLQDFARLLEDPGTSAIPHFTHLFVDEIQDSSDIDWRIYRALPIENKFYVGDPDQAIYSFRGGSVAQTLAYAANPQVQTICLEENFRSHEEICQTAQRLIQHNTGRIPKATISTKGPGGTIFELLPAANEGEEIGLVCRAIQQLQQNDRPVDPNEIAVIARTNAIAGAFQKTLAACHLPVRKRKKSDLPRDAARARAAVEFMAEPDNDTLAFLYLCTRSDGPSLATKEDAQKRIREAQAAGRSANSYWHLIPDHLKADSAPAMMQQTGCSREAVMWVTEKIAGLQTGEMAELALVLAKPEQENQEEGSGVHCLTIHAAKGREFAAVFLVGMEEETIPGRRKDANVEEERRLAYVAATRAEEFLAISWARSRATSWGAIESLSRSRFVGEMGLCLNPTDQKR